MFAADNQVSPTPPARRWRAAAGWWVTFLLGVMLYGLTANRGAQWQDSGYHILRVVTHEVVNPLGLALSHPLHHYLARTLVSILPVEPCFAVTLASALAGAIAVANVFGCIVSLTGSRLSGAFGAASLAVAHTFWQMSTVAETYTLAAALLSAECWCVSLFIKHRRQDWMVLAFLFNGAGVWNHMLAVLTTPVLILTAVLASKFEIRISKKCILFGLGAWVWGAHPYLRLILQQYQSSHDFWATLQSALFGNAYRNAVLNVSVSLSGLAIACGFVVMNFPNLLLPFALFGARSTQVPMLARRALLAVVGIHAIFVLRYSVVDQHTFFVPMYAVLAILGGVGFAAARSWSWGKLVRGAAVLFLLATPILYAFLPAVARHYQVLQGRERHKPYRDDYVYVFTPWSVAETSADRMAREAVAQAGDGLLVVEDRMAEFAVKYVARRAGNPLLRIVGPLEDRTIRDAARFPPNVVLVPKRSGVPLPVMEGCVWNPVGELYLLSCEKELVHPD